MVRDRQHGPVIELNRIQVKRSRSKGGLAGPDGMKSVFGQMVNKMSLLTQESLFLPHRVWKVKFVGESVDDCGGGELSWQRLISCLITHEDVVVIENVQVTAKVLPKCVMNFRTDRCLC